MPLIFFPEKDTPVSEPLDSNVCDRVMPDKRNSLSCDILRKERVYCLSSEANEHNAKAITHILNNMTPAQTENLINSAHITEENSHALAYLVESSLQDLNFANANTSVDAIAGRLGSRASLFKTVLLH